MILETGRIWTVDPFSSTVQGGYWPNHEWLAEVLFYAGYTVGGLPLLLLACATLITLSWCVLYALCDGEPIAVEGQGAITRSSSLDWVKAEASFDNGFTIGGNWRVHSFALRV